MDECNTSGSTRSQHQHDVDHRQDQDEIGHPHDGPVDPAATQSSPRAHERADHDGAECRQQRQSDRGAGTKEQTRQDIAAKIVGAQQEDRLIDRATKPWQRDGAELIRFEALLETVGQHDGMHDRRESFEIRPHGGRVQEIAETLAGRVRREHGRGQR